ncbi:MAG TPA: hemerythrin domain-containing protein, partial [Clostridiaceae bacterium]|nr:hemerythrin domain-containing protein [Clostridiaceae bacterium]
MTYASEGLINEHSWLIKGSEILENMTEELERGATVEIEDLRQIVMFFQLLAEKCHYPKEEQYYFELVRANSDEYGGLLDHLLDEHH